MRWSTRSRWPPRRPASRRSALVARRQTRQFHGRSPSGPRRDATTTAATVELLAYRAATAAAAAVAEHAAAVAMYGNGSGVVNYDGGGNYTDDGPYVAGGGGNCTAVTAPSPAWLFNNATGCYEEVIVKNYWALGLVIFPILTLFGNVLVIISVCRERALQSVTNYFIVSLALADLLVALVVMPFAVYVLVSWPWTRVVGSLGGRVRTPLPYPILHPNPFYPSSYVQSKILSRTLSVLTNFGYFRFG